MINPQLFDITKLNATVDKFAAEMKLKLLEKFQDGKHGWDEPGWGASARTQLLSHIVKGDPVDVANFAMFIWNLGEKTVETSE